MPHDRSQPPSTGRVYLDHAATTPMLPAAAAALVDAAALVGNASSLHGSGRRARALVEESREQVAAALGAHPTEIVFTSGGTEADNLAVLGGYAARTAADPLARGVVTSTIEHHAVLEPAEALERVEGAHLRLVAPDRAGMVAVEAVREELDRIAAGGLRTALVSLMWANNEIGTVQPVLEVAELARSRNATVHSDAVQAAGPLEVSFAESGLDLMTVSAHKLGGPVGVGVLVVGRGVPVEPIVRGGGHERGLRSGTLPTALIAACAAAVAGAAVARTEQTPRLVALRDRLLHGVLGLDLGISVGGRWTPGSAVDRLPGNVHLVVPGCEPDSLLFLLDAAGIEASTGSACQAGVPGRSHVLDAIGVPGDQPVGVVRLTLGHTTTDDDVDRALAALADCVPRARAATAFSSVDARRESA